MKPMPSKVAKAIEELKAGPPLYMIRMDDKETINRRAALVAIVERHTADLRYISARNRFLPFAEAEAAKHAMGDESRWQLAFKTAMDRMTKEAGLCR